jgi:3-phenylpropionate/cinnamic acid dioxygenase small subunit
VQDYEVAARVAIQATLSRYTRNVDTGRADQLAGLFAEDAVYDMGGGVIAHGRAAIVPKVEELKTMFATAAGFGRIRHHTTSVAIEVESSDRARVMSYFCAFAAAGPDHWGTYRDVLVREEDMWRFASRVVTLEGAVAASPVHSMLPG